jgi:NADPH:quinone reductase-like Zn-dependent oxidoreductase
MNAAVVQSFEAPPTYTTFADPVPNPDAGEVLVNVTAAALHRIVKSLANGSHYGSAGILPFVPGVDGVGLLQSPFGDLPVGTCVLFGSARPPFGTFAEQSLASSHMLIPVPAAIPDATAAAIANPAMSYAVALMRANFQPGESVLILGATGVSGQLAVQIAKSRGARRVVATGRNPEALEKLKSLGADVIISLDQDQPHLTAQLKDELDHSTPDIVLDYLWGPPAEALLAAITQRGLNHAAPRIRYIQIGNMAGPTISLPAATLRSSGLELLGSGFGSASLDQIRRALIAFFEHIATNPLQFALKTAPLSEITTLWNNEDQGVRLVFIP